MAPEASPYYLPDQMITCGDNGMESILVENFFLGCLAHASYLVGSEGVAAVIDPQRDVDIYLDAAAQHGLKIAHIIETHLHADFVSGHRELAERTGRANLSGRRSGRDVPSHGRQGRRLPSVRQVPVRFLCNARSHYRERLYCDDRPCMRLPLRALCSRATRCLSETSAAPIFPGITHRRNLPRCSTRVSMRSC